jgi:DNA-directed RNA polymerase II subunit RPB2
MNSKTFSQSAATSSKYLDFDSGYHPIMDDDIDQHDDLKSSVQIEMDKTKEVLLEHLGDYVEEPFTIIESYFRNQVSKRIVRHQLESYNNFINYQIEKTIKMFNPVTIHSDTDYIAEYDKYSLEIQISFENFKLYPPQIHENNGSTKLMFPREARMRNFTYASTMMIDIHIKYVIRDCEDMENVRYVSKIIPKINIGKIPIMVKSDICVLTQNSHINPSFTGECAVDCGGYFIIKGSEKTILGQERAAENKIYCFDGKNTTKWSWFAEIKSVPDFKCISPKQIEMMIANKDNGYRHPIYITIPRIKYPVELFVLFRALGVISDKAICEHILLNIEENKQKQMLKCLHASIITANKYMTQEDAMRHITSMVTYMPINMDREMGARKKREFMLEVLNNDLFPHCHTVKQKIFLIGYMANKLIQTSLGWLSPDNRDSYVNKRIEMPGALLNNLFRNYFNKLVKEMQKHVVHEIKTGSWRSTENHEDIINKTNIYKILKSSTIEIGINRALATGDFSIKQTNSSKAGVAQVLNRYNFPSTISHLRRINTPLEKSGELIDPRKLDNTSWGFLCPAETPEGQSIGIVNNLSYMTHLTIPTSSDSLYVYIKPYILSVDDTLPADLYKNIKVFINGCWVGISKSPMELYSSLKEKKYKGIINIYTSIVFDFKLLEIRVCNDGGRMMRPLLKVKNNRAIISRDIIQRLDKHELSWNDLLTDCVLDESVIEYIDPEEQNYTMIAMKAKNNYLHYIVNPNSSINFTHCEIHPSTIFGILASFIPFPEHNQAPRNTYQCAMGKQAIGVYTTKVEDRMDKTASILNYPGRPLVETRVMNMLNLNKVPSGHQIFVAIMTHTGYNQEDSVLINRGSLDRGLFTATIYHTEKDEDKNIIRDEIIRCKPDKTKTKGIKFGNYEKLNEQGFIPKDTLVENRDVIIAKIIPIKNNRNDPTKIMKYEDQSRIFKTNEETYIDRNYTCRNGDGYNCGKVRTRTNRKPVIGDKFSSRHGQKGTIGNIIPECDMPFTKSGIRPDLIINPHAIPSRMTIAQLKETILGKILVQLGMFGDGTSFGNLTIDTIASELQKLGFESYGNEIMYNGLTGEQIESSVFFGPVYYQRLKHMVVDKQHSRPNGPMMTLTRQPAEGRSRDGGFRVGEMERDVLIAHGMSHFCRERLYEVSDKYNMYICKKCGMIASYNDGNTSHYGQSSDFTIHSCKMCSNTTSFSNVAIPYAYKLMAQELQTINIVPRIITE